MNYLNVRYKCGDYYIKFDIENLDKCEKTDLAEVIKSLSIIREDVLGLMEGKR